jgi:hypothetical protein
MYQAIEYNRKSQLPNYGLTFTADSKEKLESMLEYCNHAAYFKVYRLEQGKAIFVGEILTKVLPQ